jgi:tetratricopeptide (TPR) repeat protein
MKTLTIGISIMPDSASLYDMRGTLLEAFGLYNEAIQDFTDGYDKAKDNILKSHLLANRGGSKFRIRDYQGSYSDLITAIKLDSTNKSALNNLAAVCDEVQKPNETLMYLEKIILIDPDYAPAYINIGFKYQGLGKHEKALEYFNKAIKLDPNEALAYSNRSFSKLKTKDLKGALEDINHSISLMPSNSYAYKIKGLIEIEKKNSSQACADFNRAVELGYPQQYGDEAEVLITKYCK